MLLLTCALFTFVACEKGPNEEVGETALVVTPLSEPLPAKGGAAELSYTLTAPVAGVEIALSEPTASWLHDLAVDSANSKITFKYDTNLLYQATEPRSASFTVTYGTLEPQTVTLQQSVLAAPFTLTWSDKTPLTSYFTCTPNDPTEFYLIEKVEKSAIASMNEEASWEENVVAWATEMVKYGYEEGMTGEYPTAEQKELNPEINSFPNTGVEAYVYVIGYSLDTAHPELTAIGLYTPEFLPAPVLNIDSSYETSHAAGSKEFDITIENAIEGATLTAVSSEAWLKATLDGSKLKVEFEANAYSKPRTATVALSYEKNRETFATAALKVTQSKNPNAEVYTFQLEVVETHWDHAIVKVTPSNKSVKYVVGSVYKGTYDNGYDGSDDVFMTSAAKDDEKFVFTGDQTSCKVPVNTNYHGFENWYFYVFAVNNDEDAAISDLNKILVEQVTNDKPSISWESDEQLSVPAEGGTFVLKYKFSAPDPNGGVKINGGTVFDTYKLLKVNPPVINEEECTVTVEINPYDSSKKYHYVNVGITYYNKETGKNYMSLSKKIVQEAPAE